MKLDLLKHELCSSKRRILYLAIAASFWPVTGMAQSADFMLDAAEEKPKDPDALRELTETLSTVEFGLGYVDEDSFRFGKYSGLKKKGAYGVLDFDIQKRGAYDSDSARYWHFKGSNLGLDSRELGFETGVQGDYRLTLDYNQIPVFHSDSSQTIFNGAGGTVLSLPAGWAASGSTRGMSNLVRNLKDFDVETERQRIGVGFKKVLSKNWSFDTTYKHETKDGTKVIGGIIGNSGGNPRAALLPEPVDYVTDEFEAKLAYADKQKQFQISYFMSLFNNENRSLMWANPYTAIGGWDPSAGFPNGQGQLAASAFYLEPFTLRPDRRHTSK